MMRVGAVENGVLCGFPRSGGRVLCVHGAGSVHALVHFTRPSLAIGNPWISLLAPLALLTVHFLAVLPEEKFLADPWRYAGFF
jgi:hypothetical protein